ncbi:YcnI family protein [Puerhibacterium sp. TATVAM-FAB25]|uniref:YcnI family copper-binding membrane protein n=1 Tax=Puerhibacterium sp. TATVAM-FAB25 TaxID=3093699 RepID=UPI00397C6190
MHARPVLRRALVTAGAALTLTALATAPASAHVRVTPDGEAAAGGYAVLTFRVPNESATAATTAVEVSLPTDTPLASVSVEPVPGWTAEVERAPLPEPVELHGTEVTEAPVRITWTADSPEAALADGEFQHFTISAGPLPEVDALMLPTTQTYTDSTVVAWDEPTPASGEEPEHPAPVLQVSAAAGAHGAADATNATDVDTTADDAAADDAASGSGLGTALGAAGLGLGLVGAVTGTVAVARTQRRAAVAAPAGADGGASADGEATR